MPGPAAACNAGIPLHPGLIGIASDFLGRYREFDRSLANLDKPIGAVTDWRIGVNVALNFNEMARQCLASANNQWLWILGDDHVFTPGLLIALLRRNVDIIVPLCLKRQHPFNPVLFDEHYRAMGWDWIHGRRGLIDITGMTTGNAGMLIKRHVLEAMRSPWFECGKVNPEVMSSDLYFCKKAAEAGFKLYLDLDNTIGHITHAVIWPHQHPDGQWGVDFKTP